MKIFLTGFWLFSISFSAMATEQRFTAVHRFGIPVEWNEKSSRFPYVQEGRKSLGTLSLTRIQALESIHPYDTEKGRPVSRPQIIDDVYYESLLLPDPIHNSDRMYPLLARAVRYPADLSYVIFELDPRARFQDGTPVTAGDVLFSLEQFKLSSAAQKKQINETVKSVTVKGREVRFDLNTAGQASRNTLMFLGGLKIVKPNTTGATLIGGIPAAFTSTGPYRITQLGQSKLSLIIDPFYWGNTLPSRRGFFNFRIIEVLAFADEAAARASLANDTANFFFESQPQAVSHTEQALLASNPDLRRMDEASIRPGSARPSFVFDLTKIKVQDVRVRQALLLAYDFDGINSIYFGGALQRPDSLLDSGRLVVTGPAKPAVQTLLATCPAPNTGAFEEHGHSLYKKLGDKRIRLLTALRLLQEAGFRLENGALMRPLPDGTYVPFTLNMLVHSKEYRTLEIFRTDLQRLGIDLQVTSAKGQSFRTLQQSQNFDLVSAYEGFLSKDGWPSPDKLTLPESHRLPCITAMIDAMKSEAPYTDLYRDNAEALARAHQLLHLSIFKGEPAQKTYFLDRRLVVPPGLSVERLHLYGYWVN